MGPVARDADGHAAVSSVVGTVLMLGITITVFAGFSLFVFDQFSEQSATLRADLEVFQEDERYLLQHQGGDSLQLASGRLLLTVAWGEEELPLTAFAGQTADGLTWRIGESLCVSGPQPPCHYDHEEVDRVQLIYDNTVVLSESDAGGPARVTTFVSSAEADPGTIDAFAAAQSSRDSNAEAALEEEAVAVPAGSGSGTFSGSSTLSNSAGSPNNALTGALSGDGTDARAILDDTGDWVEVTGFSLPATATAITSVTIGFEGSSSSTTGQLPEVRLSYSLADPPGTGASVLDQALTSTTDAQFTRSVTADHATWDVSDVETMSVRVTVTNNPNRDARIDHIYVTVQYQTAATVVYDLEAELAFSGVPDRALHTLQLDYRVVGDSFTVKVWDSGASAYVQRGVLSATTSTGWSWTLTEAEYNGGAPRLLLEDVTGDATPGTLFLDYVRVVSA
jgi:hypothetical protein